MRQHFVEGFGRICVQALNAVRNYNSGELGKVATKWMKYKEEDNLPKVEMVEALVL